VEPKKDVTELLVGQNVLLLTPRASSGKKKKKGANRIWGWTLGVQKDASEKSKGGETTTEIWGMREIVRYSF